MILPPNSCFVAIELGEGVGMVCGFVCFQENAVSVFS